MWEAAWPDIFIRCNILCLRSWNILGTVARSMPQLGLLYLLIYMPMNMLSGSNTPLESMLVGWRP